MEGLRRGPPPVRYVAIYRVNLPPPLEDVCVIREPTLEISLRTGPIEFSYSVPVTTYKPPAVAMTVAQRQVKLPVDSYLQIQVSPQDSDPRSAVTTATLRVAEIASLFDLRYSHVLAQKVYEGVVDEPGSYMLIAEGPFRISGQPVRDPEVVAGEIGRDVAALVRLPGDRRERYQLAARWYRRGHEAVNLVDKLLFWWVVLEIYPAQESTDVVGKTCDILRKEVFPDLTVEEIKSRTLLGRIAGLRGDIVHHGQAFVTTSKEKEFSDRLERLHAIVTTCLRLLADLAPGEDLHKYVRA